MDRRESRRVSLAAAMVCGARRQTPNHVQERTPAVSAGAVPTNETQKIKSLDWLGEERGQGQVVGDTWTAKTRSWGLSTGEWRRQLNNV